LITKTRPKSGISRLMPKPLEISILEPKKIQGFSGLAKHVCKKKWLFLKPFQEYKDVFAWRYDELKTYNVDIMKHQIPLKPDAKPGGSRGQSIQS